MSSSSLDPILQALSALYSGSDRQTREQAGQFLEQFQKSSEAWTICHSILGSSDGPLEAKLFAAQTLRSKIIYDMHQLPDADKQQLCSSVMNLLVSYKNGPKIIVTQLCLSLANLAIQMIQWSSPIEQVILACGNDSTSIPIILEFLKVLPEEAGDVRKIPLSDFELRERVVELLQKNSDQVMTILINYVESPATPKSAQSLIFECINSWLSEVPLVKIVNSPLLSLIFQALASDDLFDSATDCVCSMIRETRDVDESMDVIPLLYPKVIELRPRIAESREDPDAYRNFTRIFADAGETWHMLIARSPHEFRTLVEAVAECTAYDEDLEVVQFTFNFWYLLKQMLVLERYESARRELRDVYLSLVDIVINHLHYPYEEKGGDLFGNDREQEEKFRSFRHEMGDVLKDCCAVVGASYALRKAYMKINDQLQAERNGEKILWQDIEAPVFSLRAMAREVDLDESQVMPQIMDLLIQLPRHPKVQYAVILVLGRYTEWTANHPEYLDRQLPYITGAFSDKDVDLARAAAQAMMHFCSDCGRHLVKFIDDIRGFYEQVAPQINLESLYDLTDGVAHLVEAQPPDKLYDSLKAFCAPIVQRLIEKANQLPLDENVGRKIADELELLDTFARVVSYTTSTTGGGDQANPCVQFWVEVWPLVDLLVNNYGQFQPVSERLCKLMRTLMYTYRTDFFPLLPSVAEKLVLCFDKFHYGCYLWASGIAVREFGNEYSPKETQDAIWEFGLRQSISSFRYLSTVNLADIPDVVEDLFRLLNNLVGNYPYRFIPSELCKPTINAAVAVFTTENKDPIFTAIDLLHDLFSYGFATPPRSMAVMNDPAGDGTDYMGRVPVEIQNIAHQLVNSEGEVLTQQLILGFLYTFPRDCVPDGVGVLLVVFRLAGASNSVQWLQRTFSMMPTGSITAEEQQKYLESVQTLITKDDMVKLRSQTMDLISWYIRRNVTPRSDVRRIGDIRSQKFSYH
ncbi:armadillo-type protein [Lipomyces oligophaga]|uniref:armadillo-type protein n=1 Tax=Lipomyces oligophaga TaxID=45792 RepID=UPI0034CFE739